MNKRRWLHLLCTSCVCMHKIVFACQIVYIFGTSRGNYWNYFRKPCISPTNDVVIILIFCHIKSLNSWNFLVTARKRSLGQGNVLTPVCHSVHKGGFASGGICIQGGLHPGDLYPRGLGRPPPQQILRDTVNKRAVHILLECILAT